LLNQNYQLTDALNKRKIFGDWANSSPTIAEYDSKGEGQGKFPQKNVTERFAELHPKKTEGGTWREKNHHHG